MKLNIKELIEQLELAADDLRSLDSTTAQNRIHGVLVMLSGYEWLMGTAFHNVGGDDTPMTDGAYRRQRSLDRYRDS